MAGAGDVAVQPGPHRVDQKREVLRPAADLIDQNPDRGGAPCAIFPLTSDTLNTNCFSDIPDRSPLHGYWVPLIAGATGSLRATIPQSQGDGNCTGDGTFGFLTQGRLGLPLPQP